MTRFDPGCGINSPITSRPDVTRPSTWTPGPTPGGDGTERSGEHVYLTDFGIARGPREDPGLTRTGVFVGTLAYAAPERIRGERGRPAADIYALGCMLFEAVTALCGRLNRGDEIFQHDVVHPLRERQSRQPSPMQLRPWRALVMLAVAQQEAG